MRGAAGEALEPFPVEAWCAATSPARAGRSTSESGTVCGIELPPGCSEAEKLPEPIFTPATKAEIGEHDENIDFDRAVRDDRRRRAEEELRRISIELYQHAADYARERGHHHRRHQVRVRPRRRRQIVIGRGADARLLALLAGRRVRARPRPAVLRQAVRARLARRVGLGPRTPAPELPDDVVANTRARYVEAYERVTERKL